MLIWSKIVNNDSSPERSVSKVSLPSSSRRSLQSAVSRTSTALDYESLNDEPDHDEATMKPSRPRLSFTAVSLTNEHDQNDTEQSDYGFEGGLKENSKIYLNQCVQLNLV